MSLAGVATLPHPIALFDGLVSLASVDHALWFHSTHFDVNDWMLCEMQSPWSGSGRGFAQARIYTEDGNLIASVAQEAVIRS